MPDTWTRALNDYSYPVSLPDYKRSREFPDYFTRRIPGDRASTIDFEDYFRAGSEHSIKPWIEVAFWKLCGRKKRFEARVDSLADHLRDQGVTASELCCAVDLFAAKPIKTNLSVLRALLGIKAPVLALALTYPAFVCPDQFPMVDTNTARWVSENYENHNRSRETQLTPFDIGRGVVRDSHFDSYLNWVHWCRETAKTLTARTHMDWRARDVEMAVFTAAREGLSLNRLP